MSTPKKWKRLSRRTLYTDPFISLYSDQIELPNGEQINDYSVIKKPDYVLIIATTPEDKFLVMKEYKYAVDEYLWTVPAGHLAPGESPLDGAKRELLEETGFTSDDISLVTNLFEFPTKDFHNAYVVRAKNCHKSQEQSLESTETIETITLITQDQLQKDIKNGEWKAASVIAAFAVSGLL